LLRKIALHLKHVAYRISLRFGKFILDQEVTYSLFLKFVNYLPAARIRNEQSYFLVLRVFQLVAALMRARINSKPADERANLAVKYLIPTVNKLFDKNYVNYAQALLLTLEEYFLSKETEQGFEEVLASFSSHAIAAGERYRSAFPMPQHTSAKPPKMGIVTHSIAVTGFEVVMGLGPYMAPYKPTAFSMRLFDERNARTTKDALLAAGIELALTAKQRYDVFDLRKLVIEHKIDVAVWPVPPFHMFFIYAFGLANKQVWFSQYLRPNLNFSRLDDVFTTGGAGTLNRKIYNGKEWAIVPHVLDLEGIYSKTTTKQIFTPARLEKLKQWKFMECVAELLKRMPNTHFRWTGYYHDREVVEFFAKRDLNGRHSYIPWLNYKELVREIQNSDLILACFPLSLGSVENIAASFDVPIVSMYDDECNHYWRDIYWEAQKGNPVLRAICLDENGKSKILIAKTSEDYVQAAMKVLQDPDLAATYADVYRRSYDYAYFRNPNDIGKMINDFVSRLSAREEKNNEMV
jgi:hypothetical protein